MDKKNDKTPTKKEMVKGSEENKKLFEGKTKIPENDKSKEEEGDKKKKKKKEEVLNVSTDLNENDDAFYKWQMELLNQQQRQQ
mmetsp:Transcript_1457/g.966  ORF Transcript_1457/g.966 Transcript_1457/m.966 type:complete len:83 (-) Transcript_1457:837-1085(-)